jgi:hypothetical protein
LSCYGAPERWICRIYPGLALGPAVWYSQKDLHQRRGF